MPDDSGATLAGFVKEVVEPGATIITTDGTATWGLTAAGYTQQRIDETRSVAQPVRRREP